MISEKDFLNYTSNQFGNEIKESNQFTVKPIEVKIRQRTVRKCYTLVYHIPEDIDLDLVLKAWKNTFNCAGAVKKDKDGIIHIELFGDHRKDIKDFLVYEGIGTKDNVITYGN